MKDKITVKLDWFFTPLMIMYIAASLMFITVTLENIAKSLNRIAENNQCLTQ